MVSKPAPRFLLPPGPQPAGRLIEASLGLWLASCRQTFVPALLAGIASLLPTVGLFELAAPLLRHALAMFAADALPWLPRGAMVDTDGLIQAIVAWFCAPRTWLAGGVSLLLAIACITLLMVRQSQIATGFDPGAWASARMALRRMPHCIGAWLTYTALLLLLLLPMAAFAAALFLASESAGVTGLVLLLALFFFGSLLLSVPLAWASVAFGLAPFCSAIEGHGALAAQRESRRLVRGRWTHTAVVMSIPMLMYLGVASAISSVVTLAVVIAVVMGWGWMALLDGGWLLWSQLIGLVPTALALPLAFAGGTVVLHDLRARASAIPAPPPTEATSSQALAR